MSDSGNHDNHIERLLGVELKQEHPGHTEHHKAIRFYMSSPSGEGLDLTTEYQKLRGSSAATDIVTRGDEGNICLRARYSTDYDAVRQKQVPNYSRTPILFLEYLSFPNEEDRKRNKKYGYTDELKVQKERVMLPISISGRIILNRYEIKEINSRYESAIEYEKAKIRMVYQIIAQANKENSVSPLRKIPIVVQALIAGYLDPSDIYNERERIQYARKLLGDPQPSGAGADPKTDSERQSNCNSIMTFLKCLFPCTNNYNLSGHSSSK